MKAAECVNLTFYCFGTLEVFVICLKIYIYIYFIFRDISGTKCDFAVQVQLRYV